MSTVDSTAHAFWLSALISALIAGVVIGFIRAWWFALLGVVVPVAMAIVSRFVSNDSLSNSQDDLSWRTILLAVAIEVAPLFFFSFAVGARLRTLVDFLRRRARRTPAKLGDRSA
jgi:uncharacterized membrane-anchored protein